VASEYEREEREEKTRGRGEKEEKTREERA